MRLLTVDWPLFRPAERVLIRPGHETTPDERVEAALLEDKRRALKAAVIARWIALGVIAVMIVYLNPTVSALYAELILIGFALIGLLQSRIATLGRSRLAIALILCDLALMTFTLVVPNPMREVHWPPAFQYRLEGFHYFYLILAGAVLAFSWRTILSIGHWTVGLWIAALLWVMWQPVPDPGLTERIAALVPGEPMLAAFIDPNSPLLPNRIQEMVVFLLVSYTLAIATWRAGRLLRRQVEAERERSNLARYFSPNVVDELARNDEPAKQTRMQEVSVLFVDIVGFTAYAERQDPARVIATLRQFYGLMEREVFAEGGTLDKYLGDGLMATFGTPLPREGDAARALACGRAMLRAAEQWNAERERDGQPRLGVSVGIHHGPVVIGDIGSARLEFAVIGGTVNLASRLEAMTRELGSGLVASEALVRQAAAGPDRRPDNLEGLVRFEQRRVAGISEPITVWALAA